MAERFSGTGARLYAICCGLSMLPPSGLSGSCRARVVTQLYMTAGELDGCGLAPAPLSGDVPNRNATLLGLVEGRGPHGQSATRWLARLTTCLDSAEMPYSSGFYLLYHTFLGGQVALVQLYTLQRQSYIDILSPGSFTGYYSSSRSLRASDVRSKGVIGSPEWAHMTGFPEPVRTVICWPLMPNPLSLSKSQILSGLRGREPIDQ